ncbi:MAG TPA: TlpA disulfide reductase family protein [Mycobacteriales bacterium]|nr:TlpA disulfide reductase family protein [Mycobacteriales bacterium]
MAAALLSVPLLASCSVGKDAVDQAAGSQFRFVAGDGTGKVIARSDRKTAPSFSGDLVGGGHFDSTSLAGDVAVVNFWGQWCGPCRVETPDFQKAYAATKSDGVRFVGVDVKDSEQLAKAFLADKHITYPSLFDPDGRVALRFRNFPPNAIPSTIVLDRHGRVAAIFLGPLLTSDIQPLVTRLAAEA